MVHVNQQPGTRAAKVRFVLLCILAANLAVVVAKLVIGLNTNSLAVISDAMHSSVDSMNNILALVVISFAAADPTRSIPTGTRNSKPWVPWP